MSGCGDHLETIAEKEGTIHLGTIGNAPTYTSCRPLCQQAYPDFDFYHKFVNYQACQCKKMRAGFKIKTRHHGAYTFGFAATCSKIIKILDHILKRKVFY